MSTPIHSDPGASKPRARVALSRDAIVAAAVSLVDESGPDALTMRAVADRLGCGVMSLYRHVADRDELLDLVLEAMAGDVSLPHLEGDWRVDLSSIARAIRGQLLRRPHLTVLLTSRAGRGRAELPGLELTLGVLRSAGFTPGEAVLANHALGNYVAGAALWEAVGLAGATGEERSRRRAAALDAVARVPAQAFPNLHWVGGALVEGSLDERFEFGLARLLDGLEALLARDR